MNVQSGEILGVRIDATDYQNATAQILDWARASESRYVCCACVNSLMEAHDSSEFRKVMLDADLVTSDGMPLVWILRLLGVPRASRVYGPDLMAKVLEASAEAGVPVGFYGGSETVLRELVGRAKARFPGLNVVYAESPPFRPPTPAEDAQTTRAIVESGARILFVGLGGSKQDRWMNAHRRRVPAVMLGVGAAFDFFAGAKPQAPQCMRKCGLEWLFRLLTEPRRLWKRYLFHNPRFAVLACAQILRARWT